MALGSLIDGAGQIKTAADRLEEVWLVARSSWDDAVSRNLEEEQLQPLLQQVRTTLDAISRLSGVLVAACRECEDRG
ncbi:MAG: hypothetical protein JSS49_25215 [Planctomycetes bacterium]|nr:hypothetical protein [Planctomycetota bacterium]